MKNDDIEQDVSIFIVADDYQIIEPEQYDTFLDGEGHFVMVTNDVLNPEYGEDNTIYIHNHWNDFNPQRPVLRHIMDLRYIYGDGNIDICEDSLWKMYDAGDYEEDYGNFESFFDDRLFDFIADNTELFDFYPINRPNEVESGAKSNKFIWQVDCEEFKTLDSINEKSEALSDFNGYKNTKNILSETKSLIRKYNKEEDELYKSDIYEYYQYYGIIDYLEQYAPAAFAANDFSVLYENRRHHGYLPALGQLWTMHCNGIKINNALKMMDSVFYTQLATIWSSTQFNYINAWFLNLWIDDVNNTEKDEPYTVLPLIHLDFKR